MPQLPAILRAIPEARVCEMRAAAAHYFRAVMWQPPHGLAYDTLQLSLCRRALRVFQQHYPGRLLPRWAACAVRTVNDLLG